jgi:hypothetical protein
VKNSGGASCRYETANWLVVLGHPEGRVSPDFKPYLSQETIWSLRRELARWQAKVRPRVTDAATDGVMSLVALRRLAESLSWNSTLRSLILAEPDQLPFEQGIAKIQVFLRLLYKELARSLPQRGRGKLAVWGVQTLVRNK